MNNDLAFQIAQVHQRFEQLEYSIAQGMKPNELDAALIEVDRTIKLLKRLQNDMEQIERATQMRATPPVDEKHRY